MTILQDIELQYEMVLTSLTMGNACSNPYQARNYLKLHVRRSIKWNNSVVIG